jgi:hypothetical protein
MVQDLLNSQGERPECFEIRVVPTLLIFEGGVPVEVIVGIVPELVRKALGGGH